MMFSFEAARLNNWFLRALNLSASVCLLALLAWRLIIPLEGIHDPAIIEKVLGNQSLPARNYLLGRLLQARNDANTVADLASHIFSNPEGYRSSPQPSDYDYEEITGLYSSVRNDGLSLVLLSGATPLTPEILREIRLSEYLNPSLKTLATLNPDYGQLSLITSDSLVRTYPWFDFEKRIKSGQLKRNFLARDLGSFNRSFPSSAAQHIASCEVIKSEILTARPQIVCASPFFSAEGFRGLIAISIDAEKLMSQALEQMASTQPFGVLLSNDGLVVGMSATTARLTLRRSLPSTRQKLVDLDFRDPALTSVVRRLSAHVSSGAGEHFYWVSSTIPEVDTLKLISIYTQGEAATVLRPTAGKSSVFWFGAGLISLSLLLLANTWWSWKSGRRFRQANQELGASFTSLSDLNLSTVLLENAAAVGHTAELQAGDQSGHSEESQPSDLQVQEAQQSIARQLEVLSRQLAIFHCLSADDPLAVSFSKFCKLISEWLSATNVFLLFYSSQSQSLRLSYSLSEGAVKHKDGLVDLKEGIIVNSIVRLRRMLRDTASALSSAEHKALAAATGARGVLAAPLQDGERIIGAVVLIGSELYTSEDEIVLTSILEPLSLSISILFEHQGLLELDHLRREYYLHLAKAVEMPLNRIRDEIQSIYTRLGKLTPYYKQHCETILFEVGKLYEILRDTPEAEAPPKARQQFSGLP